MSKEKKKFTDKAIERIRKFIADCRNACDKLTKEVYAKLIGLAGSPTGYPTVDEILKGRQAMFFQPLEVIELCEMARKRF